MRGIVGTTRFIPGWTDKNVREIDDSQINFNEIFWRVDSFGTLLIMWVENVLLLLVTTFHNVMDILNGLRSRPRVD